MNGFLLDSGVVSRAMQPKGSGSLRDWLQGRDENQIFLSVVTLGEFRAAIERAAPDRARFERYAAALERLRSRFQDRVLSIDAAVAERSGEILGRGTLFGAPALTMAQGCMAATALVHNLTLVTLQPGIFEATTVRTADPLPNKAAHAADAAQVELGVTSRNGR